MRFFSSSWFKVSLSLGLLAMLLHWTDWQVFTQQILTARLEFFALAFVGYIAGQVLSAYKWQLLARAVGFRQPLHTFLVYYFTGMYLNLFAPSTVAGDFGRSLFLAGKRADVGRALQSVLADRVSGLVMLLWVSAGGFVLLGPTVLPAAVCYGTISGALLLIIGWWALPRMADGLFSPEHKLRRLVEKTLSPYRVETAVIGRACGLSLVFHVFQLGLQALLGYALGLSIPFWYLVLCIPLITILSALPVSLGGLGVREGGYMVFLSFIGVGRDEALAFGLLWSALIFGSGLFGGLVLLVSPQVRLSLSALQPPAASSQPEEG